MNIEYKRSMGQSYMVIEPDVLYTGFEERMLKTNDLKCLLTFYSTNSNGSNQLWYDISKKRSLRDMVEQEGLKRELLTKIMVQLELAYAEVKSFLISDSHLYLTPDTIYLDTKEDGFSLYLCYLPADDGIQEIGLEMLFEYFIQTVDHEDEELREMCYELYDGVMSQKEGIISIAERLKAQMAEQQPDSAEQTVEYEEAEEMQIADAPQEEREQIEDGDPYNDNQENKSGWHMPFFKKKGENPTKKSKPTVREKMDAVRRRLFPPKEPRIAFEDFEEEKEETYTQTTLLTESYCQGILKYQGEGQGSDFLIRKNHFTIGNLKGNDACLERETVSRHHARILKGAGGEYYLEDLNSTNGTFVNGKMLPYKQQHRLEPGDEVCFADVRYQFI